MRFSAVVQLSRPLTARNLQSLSTKSLASIDLAKFYSTNSSTRTTFANNSALSSLRLLHQQTQEKYVTFPLHQNQQSRSQSTQKSKGSHRTSSTTAASAVDKNKDDGDDKKEIVEAKVIEANDDDDHRKWLYDLGLKSVMPEWKKMFAKESVLNDVAAGLTVGCVAVPLSLAIALASGVPAEVGLVTAAVSGIAGGLMGGTTLAVTGPAAAISLLVVGAVEQHGLAALPVITLACGTLQVASGVTRMGVAAKLVPVSVIAGFTYGVGTMILSGQVPKALGMFGIPAGLNPLEIAAHIGTNLGQVDPSAAGVAAGTALALWGLPKIHSKIPAALVAVGGATVATHALGLDVALIGAIPSGLGAFQFAIPTLPEVSALPSLAATSLLIYSMTSVESLLSCAALEKMKDTGYQHDPDQELVGQGLANVSSALFMGMPVTSVIARSSLNVRCNADTRLPALVQAGFVFSGVVFFSDTLALIPIPALSGLLIMTGIGMMNPKEFQHCYAVQKSDVAPFLATWGGMLAFGLAEGIGIGCISAFALNYGNWTQKPNVLTKLQALPVPLSLPEAPQDATPATTTTYKLAGPINFVSMFEIDNLIRKMQKAPAGSDLVLDCGDVDRLEFTGVEELVHRIREVTALEKSVQMIHCSPEMLSALDVCDPDGHHCARSGKD